MPSMLGKRKARPAEEKPEDEDPAAAAARELLRKHFEARFKPVAASAPAPCAAKPKNENSNSESGSEDEDDYYDDEDEDDDSMSGQSEDDGEWGGLSGDEDDAPKVEVVDHTSSQAVNISTMSKKELKAYLSSRPPSHTANDAAQTTTPAKSKSDSNTEEDSAAFLANDLALQRLIAESHILAEAGGNSSHYLSSQAEANAIAHNKTFVEGRTRRKTTDLRLQALGAKQSILSQAKMPMGMRKGINQAAVSREGKRRKEAKENGIVLERPSATLKKSGGGVKKRRSERPVDMPGVGKMRGSMLRISARDVRSIEGVRSSGGREKKSRGRRR